MELEGLMQKLKLDHLASQLDTVCEQASQKDQSYRDFLIDVLRIEWGGRQVKGVEARLKQARFPAHRRLEEFDFSFQKSIDRKVFEELASLAFVERGHNAVFLGPPGVGKSHLAISLGLKAVEAGHRVLFLTLDELLTRLRRASMENRLDKTLQQLTYPKLLILDEMGYLPMDRQQSGLFFQLVTRRYGRASLILTSNKSFADWGEVLGDRVMATAILDRLLHHCTTINIKGESYRLKEKKKAGFKLPPDSHAVIRQSETEQLQE